MPIFAHAESVNITDQSYGSFSVGSPIDIHWRLHQSDYSYNSSFIVDILDSNKNSINQIAYPSESSVGCGVESDDLCTYTWTPPSDLPSGNYYAKITIKGDGASDVSPAIYIIGKSILKITEPNKTKTTDVSGPVKIVWSLVTPSSSYRTHPTFYVYAQPKSNSNSLSLIETVKKCDVAWGDGTHDYFCYITWYPSAEFAGGTYKIYIITHGNGDSDTSSGYIKVTPNSDQSSNPTPKTITPSTVTSAPVSTPTPVTQSNTTTDNLLLEQLNNQLQLYVKILATLLQLLVLQGNIDNSSAQQILDNLNI